MTGASRSSMLGRKIDSLYGRPPTLPPRGQLTLVVSMIGLTECADSEGGVLGGGDRGREEEGVWKARGDDIGGEGPIGPLPEGSLRSREWCMRKKEESGVEAVSDASVGIGQARALDKRWHRQLSASVRDRVNTRRHNQRPCAFKGGWDNKRLVSLTRLDLSGVFIELPPCPLCRPVALA